jgi:hypothetical protein
VIRRASALLLGVAALGITAPLHAQRPDSLVAAGVRAYRDLDFEAAAGYLRRALTLIGGRPDTTLRTEAMAYLGAADLFLERPDSVRSVFRQLVRLDPRYRLDRLIFPPEVTTVFDAARQATPVTVVALPSRARFSASDSALVGSVFASTYHQIRVEVQALDASVVRRLYAGPINDSLAIAWNGRGTDEVPVASGRYILAVSSLDSTGVAQRVLRVPLELTVVRMDTLLAPLPPTLLPVRSTGPGGLASLLGGLAIGAAVTLLPSAVASDASPGAGRFVVGGAVTIGSIVGFLSARRQHAVLSANVAVNDSLRAAWQERQAAVASENAERRRNAQITVLVGVPQVIEQGQ